LETLEEIAERIKKFGMSDKDKVYLEEEANIAECITMLSAQIEHVESNNNILREGLEKIAFGVITAREASELAQSYLEVTTLRNWRKNESDRIEHGDRI